MRSARAELEQSLREQPAARADAELSRRLREAEGRLCELADALRTWVAARLREVHHARSAASGYRPARSGHPAFVSKSV